MYVDLRSSIGRSIFATGGFDPATIKPLLDGLSPGGTFLDVGANIGFYTVLAHSRLGPAGQIYAFEIDPRPMRSLAKTIAKFNMANVAIERVGLSDHAGTAHFVPLDESGHNHLNAEGRGRAVRIDTLDGWASGRELGDVQALKIDVEGAELEVLRGARSFLSKYRPLIICEASDENLHRFGESARDLETLLKEYGYTVRDLPDAHTATLVAVPR